MSARWLCFLLSLCLACSFTSSDETKASGPLQCPECDERLCVTDLDCRPGEVLREKQSVCGCCPACVIVLGLDEPCNPTFGPSCEDGLECDPNSRTCVLKPGATCLTFQSPRVLWHPTCESDGTFAARQCKGTKLTGRCFCYSPDGKKLFGAEWWALAENMTCSCSRLGWQLENAANEADRRTDVTLHCNNLGNFEELQCDNGMCWCADEKTGDPITAVMPEDLMTVLPCYNATVIGAQYLRKCESRNIAAARIGIRMTEHGTQFRRSIKQRCDADGSYGHFQVTDDNRVLCTWKDGTTLGSYASEVSNLQSMNCNCARDQRYYAEDNMEFNKVCQGPGNYQLAQFDPSGKWYCVDADGFATNEPGTVNPGESYEEKVCKTLPPVP